MHRLVRNDPVRDAFAPASCGKDRQARDGHPRPGRITSPEKLAQRHAWAIADHFGPGVVITDRSSDGIVQDGWPLLAYSDSPRKADLALPELTITCRVSPSRQPADQLYFGHPQQFLGTTAGPGHFLAPHPQATSLPLCSPPASCSFALTTRSAAASSAASAGRPTPRRAGFVEAGYLRGPAPSVTRTRT